MRNVSIYIARFCPYCAAAKALLRREGIDFAEIDIAGNWEKRDEMIEKSNGQTKVPQIFFGTRHIGGLDELRSIQSSSGLHQALEGE